MMSGCERKVCCCIADSTVQWFTRPVVPVNLLSCSCPTKARDSMEKQKSARPRGNGQGSRGVSFLAGVVFGTINPGSTLFCVAKWPFLRNQNHWNETLGHCLQSKRPLDFVGFAPSRIWAVLSSSSFAFRGFSSEIQALNTPFHISKPEKSPRSKNLRDRIAENQERPPKTLRAFSPGPGSGRSNLRR